MFRRHHHPGPSRWVIALLAVVGLTLGPACAAHAADAPLEWSMVIAGEDLEASDRDNPLPLDPDATVPVEVRVKNTGDETVDVWRVLLEGRVLGLAFFTVGTELDMTLEPGETAERSYALRLLDLGPQATGTLPARVSLQGQDGEELVSRELAVDVRGSLRSVYGTFGLAVVGITALLVFNALFRLATGRLNRNRWWRATTFLTPGLGVGFVLTFTLSALHQLVPSGGAWATFLLVGAAVGFGVGYLTPAPPEPSEPPGSQSDPDEPADPVEHESSRSLFVDLTGGERRETPARSEERNP